MIDCDNCYHSKYGGYGDLDCKKEYCLKFDKELDSTLSITEPCNQCLGEFYVKN